MKMAVGQLAVHPFASPTDYQRMVGYFHEASDASLLAMGVDRAKIPPRDQWLEALMADFAKPLPERQSFYVCWYLDGAPVGHSNVNRLQYGQQAFVHLHLWQTVRRREGLGFELFQMSIAQYVSRLRLQLIFCEPYAANPAPNRVLEKAGFRFVRTYRTTPGPLNFEQDVNRWELDATARLAEPLQR
jgi:[ribosomal protein S5]-alanine N-acetyltransferase